MTEDKPKPCIYGKEKCRPGHRWHRACGEDTERCVARGCCGPAPIEPMTADELLAASPSTESRPPP